MKEHILTMVYLGLIYLIFNSPFPDRLLEEHIFENEKVYYPSNPKEINQNIPSEKDLRHDSIHVLSPGAAAFIDMKEF